MNRVQDDSGQFSFIIHMTHIFSKGSLYQNHMIGGGADLRQLAGLIVKNYIVKTLPVLDPMISQFIKTFPTRLEATMFEDRLQTKINHYHLGHRLHRFVAMGRHIDDEILNPTCHVFITAIPILPHTLQLETVTTATNVDLKIVR
jgi:hypothetical protein